MISQSDFYTVNSDSFSSLLSLYRRQGFVLDPSVDVSILRDVVLSRRWDSLPSVCKFLRRYLIRDQQL